MNAITTHRTAFKWANEILEMTMADSSAELAGWTPPGIANSIAATYAHAICGADGLVHGMLQAGTPLYAGEWAHKTGISDPRMDQTLEWARTVAVDLAVVRHYAEAVCASVDRFIVSRIDMSTSMFSTSWSTLLRFVPLMRSALFSRSASAAVSLSDAVSDRV